MNKNGFIITLNAYNDEPWLLNHFNNALFKRITNGATLVRGTEEVSRLKSVNWTVQGRRENEGGRWKRTSGQEAIMDKTNKVEGYKESFVYYKKLKGKEDKTGWVMTEYIPFMRVFMTIWCCVTYEERPRRKLNPRKVENNILSNQVQDEEAGAGDAAQLA
ncbi:hypothetical protein DY000_02002253 [Brassica cretica]|uniref:NAC domain-containing protein n=1 Tax=Brassica cretica TaxID=69181 RepID=A0ABQ7C3P4_BRACR|nr:hypothetical protein DY000_02002253 [Brassica cretica]